MISLTVPPSSVETVAPCTAETEPTAESTGAQSSSFTGALVTVATGIGCFVVAIFTICNALIPKIIRNNTHAQKSFDNYFACRFHFLFSPQRPLHTIHMLSRPPL